MSTLATVVATAALVGGQTTFTDQLAAVNQYVLNTTVVQIRNTANEKVSYDRGVSPNSEAPFIDQSSLACMHARAVTGHSGIGATTLSTPCDRLQ
jgi:hypothetical protein